MINKGLFTSNKGEWETPEDLFDELDKEFNFEYDLCASLKNTKCARFFEDDGGGGFLSYIKGSSHFPDIKSAFMNPPYGRKVGNFVETAYRTSLDHNITVVCLLPARTDTRWWHNYCMRGEIRFIKGRIKFIDPDNRDKKPQPAPFPSAIVIFRGTK